jgi:small subunit ribosomal protein S3
VAIERKFIEDNIKMFEVKEFLAKEVERASCGEIDIQRTPLGTRIIVYAQRPGLVIGRKGASIRKLTNILKKKYGVDNPQIEVNELEVPELNATVMARDVASAIERGIHFRRACYTALRRIMEAGARGAEIEVSGKLTGERSKSLKFVDGYIKHCGEPALMYVKEGQAQAAPKPGVIGVKVKIMPPGVKLPDEIEFIGMEEEEEKKVAKPVKEEIEELVEEIEEELGEEEVPKVKKVRPKKIKRRKAKKKVEEEETEEEIDYKSMEWSKLKELAKRRGIKVAGKGVTRDKIVEELTKLEEEAEESGDTEE